MVTRRTQSMNLHSSLTAALDWSKKWHLSINPTKYNHLTIGRAVPLRLSFFPYGSGTPITVSKLVKDLGVQADNMVSPSAQCTEAANKAGRLIFMIRRSFQDLSKSAFIPLYGASVCPASVVTAPSVNVFKKRLEKVWTGIFPHLPHRLNSHPLPPPHLHTIHCSFHLYMVPNSLLYICDFFRPIVHAG